MTEQKSKSIIEKAKDGVASIKTTMQKAVIHDNGAIIVPSENKVKTKTVFCPECDTTKVFINTTDEKLTVYRCGECSNVWSKKLKK